MKRSLFNTALALGLSLAGLSAQAQNSSASMTPEFGRDLLVDVSQGLGNEAKNAGLKPQTWKWAGVAAIDQNPNPDFQANAQNATSKNLETKPSKTTQAWIAVNMETGFEYRVDMPRAFAHQIHRYAETTGSNMGDPRFNNELQKIADELPKSKGWSNGSDTRTRAGSARRRWRAPRARRSPDGRRPGPSRAT